MRENRIHDFEDSGFFVLRTPLLPFDELLGWSDGLRSHTLSEQNGDNTEFESAWTADVQLLRIRLRDIIERSEIVHALFVASPTLKSGIEHWKSDPDSKKGLQAERAIVRYLERMSSRPTPFGIFAGYSVGQVDCQDITASLNLEKRQAYRTCSRLDFDYLFALTSALRRDPALAKELRYWPNSSLHQVSDAWHYVESRVAGTNRTYHLAKLAADEYLNRVLERARNGATYQGLLEAVLAEASDSEVSTAEAEDYVQELISSEVLVSDLVPLLTGRPPLDDLIDQLRALPSAAHVSGTLQSVRSQLAALDTKRIGVSQGSYEEIASALSSLPAKFDLERLFQVDMIKPVESAVLGKQVVEELLKGIDLACRIGETAEPEELRLFQEAFSNRYEGALVPILEALDEDMGVGFGRFATDCSPLLAGMKFGGAAGGATTGLSPWHMFLLRKLVERGDAGQRELHLDPSELPAGVGDYRSRLPDTFHISAVLAAASVTALDAGEFDLYLIGGAGPSGARMFGRFCQADPELERCVRGLLNKEESNNPNAIYAEVAYLPEGRLGNVLCRPVLREYEIPYLARSGAPEERQIQLSDLLVGVSGGRITLYSKRLRCEVIPRLSNAHGFWNPALPPVYRFLCSLQHQGGKAVPGFSWGPLENIHCLPRVRLGRLVLSVARWRLSGNEIDELGKVSKSQRFRAMQMLRQRRTLPRWVVLYESDNALTADLDNPLSVDALVHVLKRRRQATLAEMFPPPESLCVTGPEGRFQHEINVPFVRRLEPHATAKQTAWQKQIPIANSIVERGIRTIGPGRDWLYVKLYAGNATLDDVLKAALPSLVHNASTAGSCCRWFFVRYADPHTHLRIRFNGQPNRLQQELMPLIAEAFNPLLAAGRLWKIQFDTYEREIERYGGSQATSIAEDIFFADSEAALEILKCLEGDEALDSRWRIALLGADRLLSDCGLGLEAKRIVMERLRDSWHHEFQVNAQTKKQLAAKFRTERRSLEALLGYSSGDSPELSLAGPIFESRTGRVVPAIRNLHALKQAGVLHVDISDLVTSYVHMHINRLLQGSARLQEVVLYDFLCNLYDARLARERTRKQSNGAAEDQPRSYDEISGNPEFKVNAIVLGGE